MEIIAKVIEKIGEIFEIIKIIIRDWLSGREIINWKRNRELYRRYEDNDGAAVYRLATDRRKWEDALDDCYCGRCFEIGKLKNLKGDGQVMHDDGGCQYRLICHSCEADKIYYFSD